LSKGPDWTRTGTIVAYAEWLRVKSEAFAVLVLRRDDGLRKDIAAARRLRNEVAGYFGRGQSGNTHRN